MWYNASGASGHITFAGSGAGGSLVNDCLYIGNRNATTGSGDYGLQTTQLFRDPSAWYHIVLLIDTTQATSSNRIKLYVNGSQITSFVSASYPSLNYQTTAFLGGNSAAHIIGYGATTGATEYFDGYLAEMHFVDGQALTPSSFGETDAVTGVWKAKKYTGTYGTNGFYLKFANDSSSLSAQYGALLNGSSQFVSLTPTSAFNFSNNNWTIETFLWPNGTTNQVIFNYGYEGSTNRCMVFYYSGGNLNLAYSTNGTNNTDTSFGAHNFQMNQWYHVAVVRNGSTITAYINGVPLPTTINISTSSINYPGTSGAFRIGRDSTNYLSAFLHGFRIVNGTAVYTSKFKPTTTKLTAITNTQLLTLQDATLIDNSANNFTLTNNGSFSISSGIVPYATPSIAADYSGNYNNWLIGTGWNANDISDQSYSVMYDSPTNTSATVANYPTLNPLSNTSTLAGANLDATNILLAGTTMATPSTGKWYFEYTQTTSIPSGSLWVGVSSNTSAIADNQLQGYSYASDGRKVAYNSYTSGYGATWTNGDVIGCALDLDNQTITFYKNGTSQGTAFTSITAQPYVFALSAGGAASTKGGSINCGQRPFKYTPPSGFKALNTYNLPDSTIKKGNSVMDATTYTGNGSTNTITNAGGFKPDLVFLKDRSSASYYPTLFDSVRGVYKRIWSNAVDAEDTVTNSLTSFNSNGFTLGSHIGQNANGNSLVAWQWQAGQGSTSSNTAGSVTSTVSVNTTAGFSICTFTTPSASHSNFTFGHGLGVAPKMVIVKSRSASTDWVVYHVGAGATKGLYLNQDLAAQTSTGFWQDTAPSSSLVYIGTGFAGSSETAVAYCWSEVPGFSKIGSYVGNGSADGPFVYTGFRPKFIMTKRSSTAGAWHVYDSVRKTYNIDDIYTVVNSSLVENSGDNGIDFLSNGFKLRSTNTGTNENGTTIIYAAFAENPFKNSLAR
jgi:hypothetical protein